MARSHADQQRTHKRVVLAAAARQLCADFYESRACLSLLHCSSDVTADTTTTYYLSAPLLLVVQLPLTVELYHILQRSTAVY